MFQRPLVLFCFSVSVSSKHLDLPKDPRIWGYLSSRGLLAGVCIQEPCPAVRKQRETKERPVKVVCDAPPFLHMCLSGSIAFTSSNHLALNSSQYEIFHFSSKAHFATPQIPHLAPSALCSKLERRVFSERGKRSLAKIPDLQQVVRLFSEHKYNETLRLASVARGGRRVRTLHHNWSLKTLLNHLRSSLLCLFCNNGFTRREKLLSRRPVSVTAEWQLNNSLVSPLVHPDASRPEYQSSLGSGLHRKRRRGDHPGRRNRERPPRPHQQLRESTILRRIRQPPRQWQTNEEQSLELEGRPDLCICFAGPRGQLWRQRRRCRPPAKIHAAEREQVKKKRGDLAASWLHGN